MCLIEIWRMAEAGSKRKLKIAKQLDFIVNYCGMD